MIQVNLRLIGELLHSGAALSSRPGLPDWRLFVRDIITLAAATAARIINHSAASCEKKNGAQPTKSPRYSHDADDNHRGSGSSEW